MLDPRMYQMPPQVQGSPWLAMQQQQMMPPEGMVLAQNDVGATPDRAAAAEAMRSAFKIQPETTKKPTPKPTPEPEKSWSLRDIITDRTKKIKDK